MSGEQLAISDQPTSKLKLDERIMSCIPLMAPVPTAWMIGIATYSLMAFPWPVAVVSALTVEGIGFVSINTANEMREFNRHLNGIELKQRMQAPAWQAYGVSALYLVTATLMTVALHIFPSLKIYAPLPFILMTAAGGWLYALRRDHQERVKNWLEGRSQRSTRRRSAKSSDAQRSPQRRSATLSEVPSDAQRRSAKAPAKIYRCECGKQFTDRYKYSGHAGKCEIHKNGKLIPVAISQKEKVTQ
jgi:hypothetical protein